MITINGKAAQALYISGKAVAQLWRGATLVWQAVKDWWCGDDAWRGDDVW